MNLSALHSTFKGQILLNEPMANHTWLKIGGPADLFLVPSSKDDVVLAIGYCLENGLEYTILGSGSNVLVGDKGIRGAVIAVHKTLDYMKADGHSVRAGAGVLLPKLVVDLLKEGFTGMEGLGGIPGTLGGAIIMNAGAYGTEIFEFVTDVELIRAGSRQTLQKDQIHYTYRGTDLSNDIILEVGFEFERGDVEAAKERRKELLAKRKSSQPLDRPNAGSIFKNPAADFAGRLIEASGLKGTRVGDALVSEKHANFLVNDGNATASQMMALVSLVREKVKADHQVDLELEIKLLGEGFDERF
jgi:UDP-N-acetylmuramate dehydrogenase